MPDTPPPELPLRTCPHCGREERTRFERCPHCHRSYFDRPRGEVRRRRLVAAAVGAVVLVLVGVAGALALSNGNDQEARDKARQRAQVAALRARLVRLQAPHRGAAPQLRPPARATPAQQLAARRALVVAVQDRITQDARARAEAGELDGPIAETECGPILKSKTAIPDDRVLSKPIGRYDCVAVKHPIIGIEGKKVASLGFAFVAALDFKTYKYTWCRNMPAQGEAGVSLVFVRLQRACLAAKGQALGTGYVDVPDK
jgi:hypothetical protein